VKSCCFRQQVLGSADLRPLQLNDGRRLARRRIGEFALSIAVAPQSRRPTQSSHRMKKCGGDHPSIAYSGSRPEER
jgi:hypothetical protein